MPRRQKTYWNRKGASVSVCASLAWHFTSTDTHTRWPKETQFTAQHTDDSGAEVSVEPTRKREESER